MLKKLYIDNFKAFREFEIEFSQKLTVLIGTNSVGKSSVLQAIDLLCYFCTGNQQEYLNKHNWKPWELKSKLYSSSKRNIHFIATFEINHKAYEWDFTLVAKADDFTCTREKIKNVTDDVVLLSRDSKKIGWFDEKKKVFDEFPDIFIDGSMLSLIDLTQEDFKVRLPELFALKSFIVGVKSFELLSPDYMKKTSRYDKNDLGIGGERLASFFHNLSSDKKRQINDKVKEYYPYLDEIITKKKQYGYIHLALNESIMNGEISSHPIPANYISDGLLRIITIVALGALGENRKVLLLDEIEDGINPNLAAELVNYLIAIGEELNKQIIVTTHSPIMLNYFKPDSIVFLWRNDKGIIKAKGMFQSDILKNELDYMNPGEIWLNLEQDEIIRALNMVDRDGDQDDD